MPFLDVSDAFDWSFMDTVVVIRRYQSIDRHGRVQLSEKAETIDAVVVATSPTDLQRLPEEEWMNKAITITTQDRLRGPSTDEAGSVTMPDKVLWNNTMFVVRDLRDYSQYGAGFVVAIATSAQAVDAPPIPEPLGTA